MTTGALIFAFDNPDIDYTKMAAWSAYRIKQYLNIPVAVVTDSESVCKYSIFDKIIYSQPTWDGNQRYFDDIGKAVPWRNANRVDAYNLTPWERTVVLDADYVVNSDNLSPYIHSSKDFLCYRWAMDATSGQLSDWSLNYFGNKNFPMWWATVMIFNKSNMAKFIFDSMTMIRNNWNHYRDLYGIHQTQYRNDYALSISLGIVSGHTLKVDAIQGGLITINPNVTLDYTDGYFSLYYKDANNRLRHQVIAGTDFHAMGKRQLGDIIETDQRKGLFDTGIQHR